MVSSSYLYFRYLYPPFGARSEHYISHSSIIALAWLSSESRFPFQPPFALRLRLLFFGITNPVSLWWLPLCAWIWLAIQHIQIHTSSTLGERVNKCVSSIYPVRVHILYTQKYNPCPVCVTKIRIWQLNQNNKFSQQSLQDRQQIRTSRRDAHR